MGVCLSISNNSYSVLYILIMFLTVSLYFDVFPNRVLSWKTPKNNPQTSGVKKGKTCLKKKLGEARVLITNGETISCTPSVVKTMDSTTSSGKMFIEGIQMMPGQPGRVNYLRALLYVQYRRKSLLISLTRGETNKQTKAKSHPRCLTWQSPMDLDILSPK